MSKKINSCVKLLQLTCAAVF